MDQVKDCLLRDSARPAMSPAARQPNEPEPKRVTVLSNKDAHSLTPLLVAGGYKDIEGVTEGVTDNGTENTTEDGSEKHIRRMYAPSPSRYKRSERTNGGTCRTYSLAWTVLIILCLTTVSAFTPENLTELKTAKTTCLNEASSGNCPNFEATNGKIGTWDTSKVTSLHQSKSLCGVVSFC